MREKTCWPPIRMTGFPTGSGGARSCEKVTAASSCSWVSSGSEVGSTPAGSGAPPTVCSVGDRKSTRLNSSHGYISYAVFCLKKKKKKRQNKTVESSVTKGRVRESIECI